MTSSIGFSLGIGSGLDIKSLVDGLANAQKAPREAALKRREDTNQARVSALGEVASSIDSFASSLSALISGGTLFSQPSVSDASILSASAQRGARLTGLSGEIEVVQLARSQTLQSELLSGRTAPVGEGDLTLTVGGVSKTITVTAANNSLEGLAQAVNDAGMGVRASIVSDASGARLMLKGETGAAKAFSLSTTATSGLERFASATMTQVQAAQDAVVRLDGVEVRRATNSFNDLIPGVQIDLKKAAPGINVSLGVTRPTAAIETAVQDFVAAFNELQTLIADKTKAGVGAEGGALRGDFGVRELQRQLGSLTTQALNSRGNGPKNLADIGVRTNRDGTLSVNLPQLKAILASNPDGVEALFNPGQYSSDSALTVRSEIGRVKPGTYTITNAVPENGTIGASAMLNGQAMVSSGPDVVAGSTSPALGLILNIGAPVASATITVDAGLGGALQTIRDALRARGGPFATTQTRLGTEARMIADDKAKLAERSATYYDQLLQRFTTMERQVSAFKATQSYLEQQVKVWTADR